jgi:hypothetical protein
MYVDGRAAHMTNTTHHAELRGGELGGIRP